MGLATSYTAGKILELTNPAVVDGRIETNGDLVFVTQGGTEVPVGNVGGGSSGGGSSYGYKNASSSGVWSKSEITTGNGTPPNEYTTISPTAWTFSGGVGNGNDPSLIESPYADGAFDLTPESPEMLVEFRCRLEIGFAGSVIPDIISVRMGAWVGHIWSWTFPVLKETLIPASASMPGHVIQTMTTGAFHRPVYDPVSTDGYYFGLSIAAPGVGLEIKGPSGQANPFAHCQLIRIA